MEEERPLVPRAPPIPHGHGELRWPSFAVEAEQSWSGSAAHPGRCLTCWAASKAGSVWPTARSLAAACLSVAYREQPTGWQELGVTKGRWISETLRRYLLANHLSDFLRFFLYVLCRLHNLIYMVSIAGRFCCTPYVWNASLDHTGQVLTCCFQAFSIGRFALNSSARRTIQSGQSPCRLDYSSSKACLHNVSFLASPKILTGKIEKTCLPSSQEGTGTDAKA